MSVNYSFDFFIEKEDFNKEAMENLAKEVSEKVGTKLIFKNIKEELRIDAPFYKLVIKKPQDKPGSNIKYNLMNFSLSVHQDNSDSITIIGLYIDGAHLNKVRIEKKEYEANLTSLIEITKCVFESSKGIIAGAGNWGDENTSPAIKKLDLPPLGLNFFGPNYIQKIGEENLRNAPAYKVEKLKNGIMVILNKDPLNLTNEEKLEEYLKKFLE